MPDTAELLAVARAGDLEALGEAREAVAAAIRASAGTGDAATALELFARSSRVWLARGELDEGSDLAAAALAAPGAADVDVWRTRTLYADGLLAFRAGDGERSRRSNEEALRVARESGDARGECDALTGLARLALRAGRYDEVVALAAQGRERARAAADREAEAAPLHLQAAGHRLSGDHAGARGLYVESLELNRALGNAAWVTMELDCLGWVELHLGDIEAAEERFRERDARLGSDPYPKAWAKVGWAAAAALRGDALTADRRYGEATSALAGLSNKLDPDDEMELEWLRAQLSAPPARSAAG